MGGKVLVDCQTHITRLVAARMQADIMGASTVVVSRTDAEAATLLQSNHDPRDHAFILGATSATAAPLQAQLREAEAKGAGKAELSALEDKLVASAALKTFPEAVAARLGGSRGEKWMSRVVLAGMSLQAMRELAAKEFGVRDVAFDWDFPRSVEGYYKVCFPLNLHCRGCVEACPLPPFFLSSFLPFFLSPSAPPTPPPPQVRCGVELCIARGRAYAPYADLIWMETKKPGENVKKEKYVGKG